MGHPDKKSGADASASQKNPQREKLPRIIFQVGQVWEQPIEKGASLTVEKNDNGMFKVRIKGDDHSLYGTSLKINKSEVERILRDGSYKLVSPESLADNQKKVADGGGTPASMIGEVTEPTEEVIPQSVEERRSEEERAAPLVDGLSSQMFDEFGLLEIAIEKAINKVMVPVSQNISGILEENRVVLEEEYITLSEQLEAIVAAIEEARREDDELFEKIADSKSIILGQLETKRKLKAQLELLAEDLLVLERAIHESIAAAKQSETKPAPEQKLSSSIESKIGTEKYEALSQFVERVSRSLDPERKKIEPHQQSLKQYKPRLGRSLSLHCRRKSRPFYKNRPICFRMTVNSFASI